MPPFCNRQLILHYAPITGVDLIDLKIVEV